MGSTKAEVILTSYLILTSIKFETSTIFRPVETMKLYIAFILVLISYIAASPIAQNIAKDDAQQMANFMDGREMYGCEKICDDLYQYCLVFEPDTMYCTDAWLLCLAL